MDIRVPGGLQESRTRIESIHSAFHWHRGRLIRPHTAQMIGSSQALEIDNCHTSRLKFSSQTTIGARPRALTHELSRCEMIRYERNDGANSVLAQA
jgi:hypothetical protein